jgi:3-oxoadipate enol-lactonase
MTRHSAEIAGRRTTWFQSGQGRPVVLLHGFPLSAEMWRPQLEAVPHGWMLVAPDFPGFGPGARDARGVPGAASSVDDLADAVLALLRHLGIEQAAIGGLSMGGYITFALYRKAPQRFRAMILADTRSEADSPEARAARESLQTAVRAHGTTAAVEAMLPKLLGAEALAGPVGAKTREIALENDPETIVAALDALKSRPDSTPILPTITCPTLVIVGRDDQLTPVALSEAMARQIPQATLTIIPDAAHLSSMEQPKAFGAALWSFLAQR